MDVVRHPTAVALLEVAGDYLVAREAEHNLPLGILGTLRDQPGMYTETPYLATVQDAGRIALVAVMTPPYGPVLSEPGGSPDMVAAAVEALVTDLEATCPGLPTVIGPTSTVALFARRWSTVTGQPTRRQLAERIYRLSRVIAPRPTPGGWRLADERDRALLHDWVSAFHAEAMPPDSPRAEIDASIDIWIRGEDRFAYLWEDHGDVTSLVVAGSRTPNGRRIGPVYTPPAQRGRGYASALTAAASQDQLDRGSRFCFLFTDLANPTSNSIYQQVGYVPVSDVDQYRFDPA